MPAMFSNVFNMPRGLPVEVLGKIFIETLNLHDRGSLQYSKQRLYFELASKLCRNIIASLGAAWSGIRVDQRMMDGVTMFAEGAHYILPAYLCNAVNRLKTSPIDLVISFTGHDSVNIPEKDAARIGTILATQGFRVGVILDYILTENRSSRLRSVKVTGGQNWKVHGDVFSTINKYSTPKLESVTSSCLSDGGSMLVNPIMPQRLVANHTDTQSSICRVDLEGVYARWDDLEEGLNLEVLRLANIAPDFRPADCNLQGILECSASSLHTLILTNAICLSNLVGEMAQGIVNLEHVRTLTLADEDASVMTRFLSWVTLPALRSATVAVTSKTAHFEPNGDLMQAIADTFPLEDLNALTLDNVDFGATGASLLFPRLAKVEHLRFSRASVSGACSNDGTVIANSIHGMGTDVCTINIPMLVSLEIEVSCRDKKGVVRSQLANAYTFLETRYYILRNLVTSATPLQSVTVVIRKRASEELAYKYLDLDGHWVWGAGWHEITQSKYQRHLKAGNGAFPFGVECVYKDKKGETVEKHTIS